MRLRQMLAYVFLVVLAVAPVHAQTVLQVPYEKAEISWAAPADPPPAGRGVTRWYIFNCGGADIRIEAPATSVPVKAVAPTPGTYNCVLYAANNFGKSDPATVPAFEAGNIPQAPENAHIEVR